MRDYGKVHTSFWTSNDVRRLSEDGRALALYLLTSPHANIIGAFRLPDAYVAEDMQWTSERVSKGFAELFRNGFATRDRVTKWVVIGQYLRWNPIENPNQGKAAVRFFDAVAGEEAKHAIARAFSLHATHISPTVWEPFLNPSGTVHEPYRNQEQEQEQEQEHKRDVGVAPSDGSALAPSVSPDEPAPSLGSGPATGQQSLSTLELVEPSKPSPAAEVFAAYLEGWRTHVGKGAEPKLTDGRRAKIRARLKEHPIEVVRAAAAGIWRSSWHVQNGQTGFDLVVRDAAQVERFSTERGGGQRQATTYAGRMVQPAARPEDLLEPSNDENFVWSDMGEGGF